MSSFMSFVACRTVARHLGNTFANFGLVHGWLDMQLFLSRHAFQGADLEKLASLVITQSAGQQYLVGCVLTDSMVTKS